MPGWLIWLSVLPTLDFGSGHDPMVRGVEPRVGFCTPGSMLTVQSLLGILSPPLYAPPLLKHIRQDMTYIPAYTYVQLTHLKCQKIPVQGRLGGAVG